jgi:ketosteroid isomerase-like protein
VDTGRRVRAHVEIVRSAFDAIRRRDLDALLALYDPEIEFLPLTGTRVEHGGYAGHSGVLSYFDEVAEVLEEMRPYAETTRAVGEHVVVLGGRSAQGRRAGGVAARVPATASVGRSCGP